MSAPQYPDSFATRFAEIERRLADLERYPRLPTISTVGQLGIQHANIETEESTTSTVTTDLATVGPEVTVDVGKTGRVLIQGGAYVISTVTNQSAWVEAWVKYEGSASYQFAVSLVQLGNNTGGALSVDLAGNALLNLGEGTHSLRLRYGQSLSGATARFGYRWLMVQPF